MYNGVYINLQRGIDIMDAQTIFDIVATHLFTQGRRAENELGGCMYRSPDGLKCAVGVLIPDELYDPKMDYVSDGMGGKESIGVSRLVKEFPALPEFMTEHKPLFSKLQSVHDCSPLNEDRTFKKYHLKNRLRNLAFENHLDTEVLDAITV